MSTPARTARLLEIQKTYHGDDGTNILLSHDTVRSGTWFSVQDSQSKSRTCCILLSMWKHSTNILLLVLVGTADVLESL